ncbi:MAG TPA: PIN domain-containing protein [Conexibacter sp.]|nr:PIN domain-containing protein [Conexibacter sp.]
MPGRSGSRSGLWGDLPLLIDTSAFARASHPQIRGPWQDALRADRLRLAPPARMEILYTARDGVTFDSLAAQLSALRPAPLTTGVLRAAEDAMRTLAHRSAGSQRLPVIDYLIGAAAQEMGAAVIHYDRGYDTLAEVMEFESVWLAPPGALP